MTDDLDPLLLEQVPEPGPEQVVVVDEQHAQGLTVLLGLRLGRLSHYATPPGGLRSNQCSVTVTVLLPQASASASVGNQRSMCAPETAPPVSAATPSP